MLRVSQIGEWSEKQTDATAEPLALHDAQTGLAHVITNITWQGNIVSTATRFAILSGAATVLEMQCSQLTWFRSKLNIVNIDGVYKYEANNFIRLGSGITAGVMFSDLDAAASVSQAFVISGYSIREAT